MKFKVSIEVLIFLFFFSIYALTMKGQIRYGDEAERYLTAQSIVERHDLAIQFDQDLHRHIGLDGRNYSFYELGSTLPLVPFYEFGAIVATFFPYEDPNWIPLLFTNLLNPILTALTCALLFKLGTALGYSFQASLTTTLLCGLASIAWPYSKALEREPLLALFLVLSFYSAYRFRQSSQTQWLALTGASLGYLFFSKLATLILFPIIALYIVPEFFPKGKAPSTIQWLVRLSSFAFPIAVLVGTQAIYDQIRYGSFTDIGLAATWGDPIGFFSLAHLPEVMPEVLFSLGKSIFIYSPPLLLFIPAMVAFAKQKRREAWLLGAIVGVTFLFYSLYSAGVSWWGPKYLVAITPLALLPIGSLLTIARHRWKQVWYFLALATGLVGLGVQILGVVVDDREYYDITGRVVDVSGALSFLRHGEIDSLVVYLSPVGQFLQVNTYGIAMAFVAALLLAWTLWKIRQKNASGRVPLRWNVALLVLVLLIQFASFITWVVAPYRQVLVAKADTNFVAGNLLLTDGMKCYASLMYYSALDGATNYETEAVARINPLLPRARGAPKSADAMMDQLERSGDVTIEVDNATALSEDGSLKITVHEKNGIATAISSPIPVLPNSEYELSGWIKTEAISSEGSVFLTLYEDNGSWTKGRNADIKTIGEGSHDWQPFWGMVTTLPTTRRVIIKASLGGASGIAWFDRIQIAQITKDNPPSITPWSCR